MVAVANLLCVFGIAQSAQQKDEWKNEIDEFVSRADQTFDRLKRTHTVNLIRRNRKFVIEELNFKLRKGERLTRTFSYSVNAREIERLTVHYKTGKFSAEEDYYFKNQKLVYATEAHFFKSGGETNSVWSGHFYFREGELLDHRTNGHGKSETDDWTPETELLQMSRTRLRQVNSISGRRF